MSIPKNIFQTHKSFNYIKTKPKILNAMKTWMKYSNEFNYYFYSNKMCDDFMRENFDDRTYRAYSRLPMGVMKADLWRYCIIYKYGGIYADSDTICKVNPNIFISNSQLIVSPEINCPYFCQWTFSAAPNSPILKTVIDSSIYVRSIMTWKCCASPYQLTRGKALFTSLRSALLSASIAGERCLYYNGYRRVWLH